MQFKLEIDLVINFNINLIQQKSKFELDRLYIRVRLLDSFSLKIHI